MQKVRLNPLNFIRKIRVKCMGKPFVLGEKSRNSQFSLKTQGKPHWFCQKIDQFLHKQIPFQKAKIPDQNHLCNEIFHLKQPE